MRALHIKNRSKAPVATHTQHTVVVRTGIFFLAQMYRDRAAAFFYVRFVVFFTFRGLAENHKSATDAWIERHVLLVSSTIHLPDASAISQHITCPYVWPSWTFLLLQLDFSHTTRTSTTLRSSVLCAPHEKSQKWKEIDIILCACGSHRAHRAHKHASNIYSTHPQYNNIISFSFCSAPFWRIVCHAIFIDVCMAYLLHAAAWM